MIGAFLDMETKMNVKQFLLSRITKILTVHSGENKNSFMQKSLCKCKIGVLTQPEGSEKASGRN